MILYQNSRSPPYREHSDRHRILPNIAAFRSLFSPTIQCILSAVLHVQLPSRHNSQDEQSSDVIARHRYLPTIIKDTIMWARNQLQPQLNIDPFAMLQMVAPIVIAIERVHDVS